MPKMINLFIYILLYAVAARPCKLGMNSKWNLSEEKLAKEASDIVVAQLVDVNTIKDNFADLKFKIIQVKKGNNKDQYVHIKNVKKTKSDLVSYGKTCNFQFNYIKGKTYLIYVGILNPYAIKMVDEGDK